MATDEQTVVPPVTTEDKSGFSVEWDPPAIRIVDKHGKKSKCKGDFAIKLTKLVEAGAQTGYLASVKRAIDCTERQCFFMVESISHHSRFMSQLNNSFGSGGMSLALSEAQFSHFFQYLKGDMTGLPIVKAVSHIGDQGDEVWVLNECTQIGADGKMIQEDNRKYIWLEEALGMSTVSLEHLIPSINCPLSSAVLFRLIGTLEVALKHNFIPCLLMLGGMITSFHSIAMKSGELCPVVVAYGASQTGKSTSIRVAMKLIGVPEGSIFTEFTSAFIMQRASVSTLPFGLDDPASAPRKGRDLNEIIVDLFNRGSSGSMRGENRPKSLPLVATNYKLKDEERVSSRVCVVPFSKPSVAPGTDHEFTAYDDLDELMEDNSLSSVIGWIITLKESLRDKSQRKEAKKYLRGHFTGRNLNNWAIVVQATTELLKEAGFSHYIEKVIDFLLECGDQSQHPSTRSIIRDTITDVLRNISGKPPNAVLKFMRTDLKVNHEQVLAVVFNDIPLTHPLDQIRYALTTNKLGASNIAKDFLKFNDTRSTIVTRDKNSVRRKCEIIFKREIEEFWDDLVASTTPGKSREEDNETKNMSGNSREENAETKNTGGKSREEDAKAMNTGGKSREEDDEAMNTGGKSRKEDAKAMNTGGKSREEDVKAMDTGGKSREEDDEAINTGGKSREEDAKAMDTGGKSREEDVKAMDTGGKSREEDDEAMNTGGKSREEDDEAMNTDGKSREKDDEASGKCREEDDEAMNTGGKSREGDDEAMKSDENSREETKGGTTPIVKKRKRKGTRFTRAKKRKTVLHD